MEIVGFIIKRFMGITFSFFGYPVTFLQFFCFCFLAGLVLRFLYGLFK